MQSKIDYDIDDLKVHMARMMLGDEIAYAVNHIMEFANTVNKLNDGLTSYTPLQVLGVMIQPVKPIHEMVAMLKTSKTGYYPTLEQIQAAKFLTNRNIVKESQMFVEADRCEGRTLRLAHETIGYLLANPGKWVQIRDHYDNVSGNKELSTMVTKMLQGVGVGVETRTIADPNSLDRLYQLSINPLQKPKVLK